MQPLPLFQVDAFTDEPFAGNPAAVVILDAPRPDAWLQSLAAENNLSETAYLLREDDAWRLRWFTPRVEVDLCGHATLAAAHVLATEGVRAKGPAYHAAGPRQAGTDRDAFSFRTRSGELAAVVRSDRWIELDFPAAMPVAEPVPPELLTALGGDGGIDTVWSGVVGHFRLIEVASPEIVSELAPDFAAVAAADERSPLVTAQGGPDDFVSRFFAPRVGIDEDPVTGSAHCVLAPYWSERLGRTELVGYQASARGGTVRTRVAGERVFLSGQAVTVMRGQLCESLS